MIPNLTSNTASTAGTQAQSFQGDVRCSGEGLERVRFFARQLITADDLMQEQEYFRARLRRHNRLLHGWGVVCGCGITPTDRDYTVCIQPGFAISPQGDEILIDRCVSVDLSRQGLDGNAVTACGDDADPWCSSVRLDLRPNTVVYLAIAYHEEPCRPVRVQAGGCGCDGSQCEYSRIREGYAVRVLSALPAPYLRQPPGNDAIFACTDGVRPCPECIDEPWVVLARISIPGKQISAANIDNIHYRRHVAAFGDWWFACADGQRTDYPNAYPAESSGTSSSSDLGRLSLHRVESGPLAGRVLRNVRGAQPGVGEFSAEHLAAFAVLTALDPHASSRAEDIPIRVATIRALATRGAPAKGARRSSVPRELGRAGSGQSELTLASSLGAPDAFEVEFEGAPLAFDSVEPGTFRVLAADGSPISGQISLPDHNRARLTLDAPLAPGDYTVELVGAPAEIGGPAIRSHQGVGLRGRDQEGGNVHLALHVGA